MAAKKYPGVRVHGDTIRVDFMYQGKRCREPLKGLKVTPTNMKYAANLLGGIKTEIAQRKFVYAKHFPESPRAIEFEGMANKAQTVDQAIDAWLDICEAKKAPSTYINYRRKAKYVREKFGSRALATITLSELEAFQVSLVKHKRLKPKTANDVFTVLRGIFKRARADRIIAENPLDSLENFEPISTTEPDPFTRADLDRLAGHKTHRAPELCAFMFNCWAGLSISELIALAWEDVDLNRWAVRVRRARVSGEYKVPKEKIREREIELVEPAIYWLKQLREHTFMMPPRPIEVRQRDNITITAESVRPVLVNSSPVARGAAHNNDQNLGRWLAEHCRRAGVRPRGANQMRHTFASQCITAGIPLEWIAGQLGHSDTTMLKKHYGKLIPKDRPTLAGLFSEMLGFERKHTQAPAAPRALG